MHPTPPPSPAFSYMTVSLPPTPVIDLTEEPPLPPYVQLLPCYEEIEVDGQIQFAEVLDLDNIIDMNSSFQ